MQSFPTKRTLLNPKFDGYRLDPIPQDRAVSRFNLSRKPTQSTTSGKTPLSFQEMRSRITHNHLTVDAESGNAIYVDEDFNVCLLGIPASGDVATPSFRILYEMPTPMDSSSSQDIRREYPSSAFVSSSTVAVSDGNGLLYILPIKEGGMAEPIGTFTLRTGGAFDAPFRLHHIHRSSPTTIVALLSSRSYPPKEEKKTAKAEFDIWAAKIDLLSLHASDETRPLEVLWHRRGQDVPVYATFVDEMDSHFIIGGSPYPDPEVPTVKPYEPTPDEIAPIPRADEKLDEDAPTTTGSTDEPPPYSWTQTADSVTVAFPLPSNVTKDKMKVLFTLQTLTLHVDAQALEGSPISIPHYSTKALWDSVNTTSCFWTWDREAEHAYGLLTLHMEKKNEGTRWMQVFAASATGEKGEPEVPETLDPSELWLIRESLEKYTSALQTGQDASGLGLGGGVPSLIEGEMDEEADAAVGRQGYTTWVDTTGTTPSWFRPNAPPPGSPYEDESVTLLAAPMPGSPSAHLGGLQLVLKHDLDGTVFTFDTYNPDTWEHSSTYSALAFVLASKQDTRFTYHLPSKGVFAFEGGSIRDRGANVYLYRPPVNPKDAVAKQSVLQIDDGSGGALLGVGCVRGAGQGDVVLVCLTEGELVLVRGI
ncbi:hypothetical protein D9619_007212 [Psilocybe cf. subviscida]|uniref:NudC domain-containing protein 1 n=1 Tax=Psilocybe cf. subviscida TaxID=2480587 RepID=A0A8H5B206_9AGAR|nr:hypothetical protein D9619_007212 [Psilocybe cf. subviscida]